MATIGSRIPNPISENSSTPSRTAWIDRAGNRWYKIRVITTVYPSGAGRKEGFILVRIDATGTVLEMTYAENGYPDDARAGPEPEVHDLPPAAVTTPRLVAV